MIRSATGMDLHKICILGAHHGHQMLYQKDYELMEKCLPRIILAEEDIPADFKGLPPHREVVGYYHYIVSGDPGFEEMLRCYRQMPETLICEAVGHSLLPNKHPLCVVMQGACHRDTFEELIKYLQERYREIWCWNSVTDPSKPSGKIEGYKKLGFEYYPKDRYRFWNVHKHGYSVYQLGRWKKR